VRSLDYPGSSPHADAGERKPPVSKAKYGFIRDRQLRDKDSAVELFPEEKEGYDKVKSVL